MGLFNNLMSKIFSHASATSATTAPATTTPAPAPAAGGGAAPAAAVAAPPVVDVAAVLNDMAKKNPEKLDWQHSIVDLMKLVGMDSSLGARKQLATELKYSGNMNDSASMNVWLQKEVLKQLAANGGKVPQNLLS